MRKLLLISFIFIQTVCFGQYPFTTPQGNTNNLWYNRGSFGVDAGFVFRTSYTDTTGANSAFYISGTPGILIRTGDVLWLRNNSATKWNQIVTGNSGWLTIGNAETVAGTSFVGTTDDRPLELRANNVRSGFLTYSANPNLGRNTSFGYGAGANFNPSLTNGHIAIGYEALANMEHGGDDIAIGNQAMYSTNDDGSGGSASESVVVGTFAARAQTTGSKSAFFGHYIHNVIGTENAIFGIHGFESNYNGNYNAGYGNSNLRWNIRGVFNTAGGMSAQYLGTTSITSINFTAGSGYTDGVYNLVISSPRPSVIPGIPATQATATATISGGSVVSVSVTNPGNNYGDDRLPNTVTLPGSAGAGTGATFTPVFTSASYNTSNGASSLVYNEYGIGNTANGYEAGYGDGGNEATLLDDYMTFIGYNCSRSNSIARTTKLEKSSSFGYNAKVGGSKMIVLGATGLDQPNVGIGTETPAKIFHTVGTVRFASLGTASGDTTTYKPMGIDINGDIIPMTYWPGSGGGGGVTSVSGTSNRITSTGGTTPVIDISASYVGQSSITTLGTVTAGTWGTGAVIARPTMTLGSDATGDIYYRNGSGVLTRLGIGSTNDVLTVSGGLPTWAAPSGGSGITVGTTTISSGTDTRVGFNDGGVYGESSLFAFNKTTNSLTIGGGSINANGFETRMQAGGGANTWVGVTQFNTAGFVASNTTVLNAYSSGISINPAGGSPTPDASAVLDVQSTTQGVLMPRMTATQGSAISSPADGLIIYVTNTNGTFTSVGFWGREAGAWVKL